MIGKSRECVMFVNSPINLMLAIQIRRTLYKNKVFDLVLSNGTSGLRDAFYTHILDSVFNHVYFSDYENINRSSIIRGIFNPSVIWRILTGADFIDYQNIFFWNPTLLFQSYVTDLTRRNKPFNLHLYADAISGYFTDQPDEFIGGKYGFVWRKIFKYPCVKNMSYDYYMYCPEYMGYESNHDIVSVPAISTDDNEYKEICNKIFGNINEIKEKVIILDTVHSENFLNPDDGINNIREIIKLYGSENVAVKPHPRQDKKIYASLNINVINGTFPFELYCMNHGIDDKLIISYGSSSSLLPYILFNSQHELIYIKTDCVDRQNHGKKMDAFVQKLIDGGKKIIMNDSFRQALDGIRGGGIIY